MKEGDRQPEYTARDAAKEFIRSYVLRGDALQWLKESHMGSYNDRYSAQIGGYMISGYKLEGERRTRRKPDQVGVSKLEGAAVHQIFPLPELYREVQDEADPAKYRQGRLFSRP